MDPWFRTAYINPAKVEYINERAVTELLSLLPTEPDPAVQVHQEEKEVQPGPAFKKIRSLSSFFPKKTPTPSLSQDLSKISEDADSLKWLKKHEENFPRLRNLAKK